VQTKAHGFCAFFLIHQLSTFNPPQIDPMAAGLRDRRRWLRVKPRESNPENPVNPV
jgi:hypothetical protein